MSRWPDRPKLALLAASALFAALSVATGGPQRGWVVVQPVPIGQRVTGSDVKWEPIPAGSVPGQGEYAKVGLMPGMVLLPSDLTPEPERPQDSVTLSVGIAAINGLQAGDVVRLGQATRSGVWLSPPVLVQAVSGPGLDGVGGTIEVSGPQSVVVALARRAAQSTEGWVVINVGGS